MKYYVVADVHGYYSYLIKALEEAGFFDETELCKLVVCGDLLDRGEEARELVEFMMGLLKEDRLIYILGNHEDLLVQCLQEISRGEVYRIALGMSHHYRNGTWDTLLQLADMEADDAFNDPAELCEAYHSIGICVFKCSACQEKRTRNFHNSSSFSCW